ncbi:MAG: ACT domain-containing protein, partial [Pseudomonadota bacterium]
EKLFQVKIQVRVHHIAGAFAEVATAIAENDSNINQVHTHEGLDTIRQIDFVIDVRDREHLATVIRSIYRLPKVSRVSRQIG